MSSIKVRLAAPIQPDSIVDGEGIRTVIWFQGCSHNCYGCHNPEAHDFKAGFDKDVDEIVDELKKLEFQDGVTFSGGDPMFQPEALLYLLKEIKKLNLNSWVYTGFTFEELLELSKKKEIYADILNNTDVLVDGRFEMDKRSFNVVFRGSSNQRILDAKKSYKQGKAVIIEKYA